MRRSLVALALALVLPLPAFAGQVTVKEGETLSEIADRYGLSVNQLMKLNGLSNADHVESGQSLKVPGAAGGRSTGVSASGRVTVRDGETLSEIADRHGMNVNQLMKLNGLSNADHVESGQTLLVSGPSKSATTDSGFRRGASEHVVQSGESLSVIANGYGIGLSKLIAINAINDPDHVEAGTRLKLKGNPPVSRPASPRPTASKTASPRPVVSQPLAAQPVAPRPRPTSTSRPASTAAAAPARSTASAAVDAEPTPETRPSATPTTSTPIGSRPSLRSTAATSNAATALATSTAATAIASTASTATARTFETVRPITATTLASSSSAASSTGRTAISRSQAITPVSDSAPATTRSVSPVAVRPTITSRPVATVATAPRAATTAVSPGAGKPDWRTYGPLQVDWTGWQPMGGSMVAPTLNAQGQSLYMAINCGARKLNATTPTGDWKTWDDPSADFELQLVNDYCRNRS